MKYETEIADYKICDSQTATWQQGYSFMNIVCKSVPINYIF